MKAMITGVTGQSGSHMADLLLEKGYVVVGIARRTSTQNTERIAHLLDNENFILEQADISDQTSIINILKKHRDVNELYNFAAQSHVGTSFTQPSLTFDFTAKSVINILQSLVDLDMKNVKVYQASSSEMFGKNYNTRSVNGKMERYQNENTNFEPQSPYAIAKLAAHHTARVYRQSYGIHVSCGILFNHEGPRRGEDFVTRKITKWIGRYLKWLKLNNLKPSDISAMCVNTDTIFASGVQSSFKKLKLGNIHASRDWGYAPDYMEAAWLMLQQKTPGDYVICTGETHTVKEFLDAAFDAVGISDWSNLVMYEDSLVRPSEVSYLKGDCSLARQVLGWTPSCTFLSLVEKMIENDTKL